MKPSRGGGCRRGTSMRSLRLGALELHRGVVADVRDRAAEAGAVAEPDLRRGVEVARELRGDAGRQQELALGPVVLALEPELALGDRAALQLQLENAVG